MIFTTRTVVGGLITGAATLMLTFMQITEDGSTAVTLSFILPMVAAVLVAYYVVFGGVKNRPHRLGASAGVALIFLVLLWALNLLLTGQLSLLPPIFGIAVWLCLIAAVFAVAVVAVVWIASMRRVRLAH